MPSPPGVFVGIRSGWPLRMINENSIMKLCTKTPAVNRSGENRPRENGFTHFAGPPVNSPAATTRENNDKIPLCATAETSFQEAVAEQREPGSNILCPLSH